MIEEKSFLNCRIECDGYIGTIKYVGPVGETEGQWLGVDWDDAKRGKHSGIYEGTHYFDTWHPTSGSFIRPQKANFGISCPEAIRIRYGLVDDDRVGIDQETIESAQKKFNVSFIEMVGFKKVNKKQSKFNELKIICLENQCVSSAGDDGELNSLCPSVEEIDLSKNLFNSWNPIIDICNQLPHLKELNISDNRLPVPDDIERYKNSFINLRSITMARMNYYWNDIIKCTKAFPNITDIFLTSNLISYLNDISTSLNNVEEMSLEQNMIGDWNEVLKLGKLPCLKNLNLNCNKICHVKFETNGNAKTDLFSSLKQLHLSSNLISDWRNVSELDKLKCLEDLRFRENPVLQGESVMTVRQYIIARISDLKILNGTPITFTERRGAEYDYIKKYSSQWLNVNDMPREKEMFIEEHPRFPSLVDKYGVIEVKTVKTDFSSFVITVEFVCMNEAANCKKSVKKKILKNMEVQKLMGIVQRLFPINGTIPTLYLVRSDLPDHEILLEKPLQEVSYYLVEDGDKILVRW